MRRNRSALIFVPALLAVGVLNPVPAQEPARADLILHGGRVWTVDPAYPVAEAVAIRRNRIVRVGTSVEVLALRGPDTHVLDLDGQLVLPGFNDGHTHFENAVDWFFAVVLFDVDDRCTLLDRLAEATRRVPAGMWIEGGDWGAKTAWGAQSERRTIDNFVPTLAELDSVAPDHPVILRRWDGLHVANSKAFEYARVTKHTPPPRGGSYDRDPETGELTGVLIGRAADRMVRLMPPMSLQKKGIGARAVLQDLAGKGITSIQDIARIDEISQRQLYHTHVERSFSDLEIFREMRRRGELTVRVHAQLPLDVIDDLVEHGIRPGGGGRIRYGSLKGFVDGTFMFEPYRDRPGYYGSYTFRFVDEETFISNILKADQAGFSPGIHVVGDRAISLAIDAYARAERENAPRERRFRLIHMWYPSDREIRRAGERGLAADITPVHLFRELKLAEAMLGPERARTAHAWRSMIKAGMRVNIVSDFPGSYYRTSVSPVDPLRNIYHAVTRQDSAGHPSGGWHPEEALTIEQAIEIGRAHV